jgi:uncharacterized protein YdaU (DUF1376 family)
MAEFPALPLWTDAYLGDTTHLTTIEHGAYLLLLMSMWRTKDATLPNDDKLLARYARLTPGQWARIKPVLMPFFRVANDWITQGRLSDEHNFVRQRRLKASNSINARWLKNKETADTSVSSENYERNTPTPTPIPIESPNGDSPPDPPQSLPIDSSSGQQPDELQIALAEYNQIAKQVGWPIAAKFDEDRRRKLRQRLNDAGGLAGWRQALLKASASNHCRGQNSRGWVLSLDFLLQASSFTKLMEGNYDNRRPIAAQPAVNRREYDPDESRRRTLEAFPDLVGRDCGAFTGPGH